MIIVRLASTSPPCAPLRSHALERTMSPTSPAISRHRPILRAGWCRPTTMQRAESPASSKRRAATTRAQHRPMRSTVSSIARTEPSPPSSWVTISGNKLTSIHACSRRRSVSARLSLRPPSCNSIMLTARRTTTATCRRFGYGIHK